MPHTRGAEKSLQNTMASTYSSSSLPSATLSLPAFGMRPARWKPSESHILMLGMFET